MTLKLRLGMFSHLEAATDEVQMWLVEKLLSFPKVVAASRGVKCVMSGTNMSPLVARDVCTMLKTGAADDDDLPAMFEPSFWQMLRLLVWLRRKGFCRPACNLDVLLAFLEAEVYTDNATARAVQLLRAKPDNSLLRRLPADVFNFVLLPMLRWPPYEGDLHVPGLSSADLSTLVHASF